ncbi:Protein EXPORTIN 1A, partial [Linum perenne]
ISSNEASFRQERLYVNKLDMILVQSDVQILKHEWPSRWQRFIPDLVAISKGSETVCENCMTILKVSLFIFSFCSKLTLLLVLVLLTLLCQLLSEDVFDFSHGEMIELKVVVLKITLNR